MTNENYYVVSGWMINDLKLSGHNLIAYAIIYGFSQDGESMFRGSLGDLAKWMTVSKSSVQRSLSELVDSGLLVRHTEVVSGVTFSRYRAKRPRSHGEQGVVTDKKQDISDEQGAVTVNRGYSHGEQGGIVTMTTNKDVLKNNKEEENSSGDFFSKVFGIMQSMFPTVSEKLIIGQVNMFCEKYNERDVINLVALIKTWGDRMPKEEPEPLRTGDDLFQFVWKEVKAQAPNGDWSWQKYAAQEIVSKNNKIKDADVSGLVAAFIQAAKDKTRGKQTTVQA